MSIQSEAQRWLENITPEEQFQLSALQKDESALQDAFRCDLKFGTAGLRGILGLGSNRMNEYTVGRATQGLAEYLATTCSQPSVAIARDSRNRGAEFVLLAASVLAANGVRAFLYPRPVPTPALSFAVRDLGCSAGINVTASHNPAEYNGYKVYGADGCQITSSMAEGIQNAIEGVDYFEGVRRMDLEEAQECGLVQWITEDTLDRFIDAVELQAFDIEEPEEEDSPALGCDFAAPGDPSGVDKMQQRKSEEGTSEEPSRLTVVYTPLNGTGLECVQRILNRIGNINIVIVEEQAQPDGDFPTCPYPNPEERAALERGLALCEDVQPDLLLATDPDADRVGIAVKHEGEYTLLTGNEVGTLLLDFICQQRLERGEDLSQAVVLSTIVSTAMTSELAKHYGFQLRRTLTGFKHMGEQIGKLEAAGQTERFIFGFEESYGYLAGAHVRDKDAVVASMLICQMALWYKRAGRDLVQVMDSLYQRHGYWRNVTVNVAYPGAQGAQRMKELTANLRANPLEEIAGLKVTKVIDYAVGAAMPVDNPHPQDTAQTLPPADVIEFQLEGGNKLLVRPSGTEPKIKAYVFACGSSAEEAQGLLSSLEAAAKSILE